MLKLTQISAKQATATLQQLTQQLNNSSARWSLTTTDYEIVLLVNSHI
jgi:hypothetical protein